MTETISVLTVGALLVALHVRPGNLGRVSGESNARGRDSGAVGAAILKAVLPAVCFAAPLLVACSGDAEQTSRGRTGTAPVGDEGETARARTLPEEGALPPRKYSTGGRFEPSLSFELGEGWRVLGASGPRAPNLGYVAPGRDVAQGEGVRLRSVREVFEPRERGGDVLFGAEPAPDDMVGWFLGHPYVDAEEPEAAEVGGISGKRFGADVDAPEGYRAVREGGCAVPCLPLFLDAGDSPTRITRRGRDELVVLENVEGETVVFIISAPGEKFDAFLPKAGGVLRTVEWEGAQVGGAPPRRSRPVSGMHRTDDRTALPVSQVSGRQEDRVRAQSYVRPSHVSSPPCSQNRLEGGLRTSRERFSGATRRDLCCRRLWRPHQLEPPFWACLP